MTWRMSEPAARGERRELLWVEMGREVVRNQRSEESRESLEW